VFFNKYEYLVQDAPNSVSSSGEAILPKSASISNIYSTANLYENGTFVLRPDFNIGSEQIIINKSNKLGNFQKNYQVFNIVGRTENNMYLVRTGSVPDSKRTYFSKIHFSSDDKQYKDADSVELPLKNSSKSIFGIVFSSPGDYRENSRGMLNEESEEFSAHNSINFRNLYAKKDLNLSASHQFTVINNTSNHTVPRNYRTIYKHSGSSVSAYSQHDNAFISFPLPSYSSSYHWVNSSTSGTIEAQPIDYSSTNITISKTFNTSSAVLSSNVALTGSNLNKYLLNLNGPYQHPSWKQIRNTDSIIQKTLRENNQFTVKDPDTFDSLGAPKESQTFTLVTEPVVEFNRPAIVTTKSGSSFEVSYENLKNFYSNEYFKDILPQKKNTILEKIISKKDDLQIKSISTVNYVYPSKDKVTLQDSFDREGYAEVAGTGSNGYDRNIADIRTIWRDNLSDRARTRGKNSSSGTGSISAMNYPNYSSSRDNQNYKDLFSNSAASLIMNFSSSYAPGSYFLSPINLLSGTLNRYDSVWPMDYDLTLSASFKGPISSSGAPSFSSTYAFGRQIIDSLNFNVLNLQLNQYYFNNSGIGELAQFNDFDKFKIALNQITSSNLQNVTIEDSSGVSYNIKKYRYEEDAKKTEFYDGSSYVSFTQLRHKPRPIFVHTEYDKVVKSLRNNSYISSSTQNVTSSKTTTFYKYSTNTLSNNAPWYDSYQEYANDFIQQAYTYATVPEFKVSDSIESYITSNKFININSSNTKNYLYNEGKLTAPDINHISSSKLDLIGDKTPSKLKINIKGIKKLRPYNGFYPQQRAVQVTNLFQESYLGITQELITGSHVASNGYNICPLDQKVQTILQPFFAPGILFNSIKSGIASVWPSIITSSVHYSASNASFASLYVPPFYTHRDYDDTNGDTRNRNLFINTASDIFKFETILDIDTAFSKYEKSISSSLHYLDPTMYSNEAFVGRQYVGKQSSDYSFPNYQIYNPVSDLSNNKDKRYNFAINNYLSEIVNFYITDGKLTSFVSEPESNFQVLKPNVKYYMDIVITKDKDFSMFSSSSVGEFFGPRFLYDNNSTPISDQSQAIENKETAYAPYVPPYQYGDSILRLSFMHTESSARKFILDEIFSNLQVENLSPSLLQLFNNIGFTGSIDTIPSYFFRNTLENVLDYKAKVADKEIVFDEKGTAQQTTNKEKFKWVIQNKFECPLLNFNTSLNKTVNNIELVNSYNDYFQYKYTASNPTFEDYSYQLDSYKKTVTGIWGGYGEVPNSGKGVILKIKESFTPNSNTGSLLQACGFKEASKDVGTIKSSLNLSEGLVIIPCIKKTTIDVPDGFVQKQISDGLLEDNLFISLSKEYVNKQINLGIDVFNPNQNLDELNKKLLSSTTQNNIVDLLNGMVNYNLPYHLNWLVNKEEPFLMFFKEISSTISRQDLSDIWQGLMPNIAKNHEYFENLSIEEDIGASIPASVIKIIRDSGFELKLLVFKVKKRAIIDYSTLTANNSDDNRFTFEFKGQKLKPYYSYNWPYDYFSLVELINIEAGFETEFD
jgi:hypothetical protein